MTKFLTKSVLAATVAFMATPALALQAAPAGDTDFTARAAIVKPVTLVNETDLDFGSTIMNPGLTTAKVSVGNTTGNLAMCSATTLSCSGGSPAGFTVSGPADQTVVITVDDAPAELTHSNLTNKVAFKANTVANVPLGSTGIATFNIGGEITVQSTTIAGEYTATIGVSANYE
jgi:hypothetical protein